MAYIGKEVNQQIVLLVFQNKTLLQVQLLRTL